MSEYKLPEMFNISANEIKQYIPEIEADNADADAGTKHEALVHRLDVLAELQLTQMSADVFLRSGKGYTLRAIVQEQAEHRAILTDIRSALSAICTAQKIDVQQVTGVNSNVTRRAARKAEAAAKAEAEAEAEKAAAAA